jgi:NAD-dependent SIR2 family protein deacetylase
MNFTETLCRLHNEINDAKAIVVGAGAGLSVSAGFGYSGKRFDENFYDMKERYGFTDMYSASFYDFTTEEEKWAYWSRLVCLNRYEPGAGQAYLNLLELLKGKNFFVITTNVDHQFQKAMFPKERLFYTQGDYGLFQCAKPCHQKTYDNENAVRRMKAEQKDCQIPSALIPRCPVCGGPMSMNLRADDTFVEDAFWHKASTRYIDFIKQHGKSHILYLELGVGGNTPGVIKYPFWKMTYTNPNAVYACINLGNTAVPQEIEKQSLCIKRDIGEVLNKLLRGAIRGSYNDNHCCPVKIG